MNDEHLHLIFNHLPIDSVFVLASGIRLKKEQTKLTGLWHWCLSTNLASLSHKYRWLNKKENKLTFIATYQKRNIGIHLTYKL